MLLIWFKYLWWAPHDSIRFWYMQWINATKQYNSWGVIRRDLAIATEAHALARQFSYLWKKIMINKLKELCTSQWQRIWKSKTLLIYHILFSISIFIRNEQLNFSGNTESVHISTMASAYISLLITYPECCWIRTKPKVDIHLELNSHTLLKV